MDESERRGLREALKDVESAHFRVNELLATEHEDFALTPDMHVTPRELAALREIDANLQAASSELWSLSERPA